MPTHDRSRHTGYQRIRRGLLLVPLLSCVLGVAGPSAAPPDCDLRGEVVGSPFEVSPIHVVGQASSPDVVSGYLELTRRRGDTGATVWKQPDASGTTTLISGSVGKEQIRTVSFEPCGSVKVTTVDPRTGVGQASVKLPPVVTSTTPATEIYNAGLGDWDRDGRADALILQIAADGVVVQDPQGRTLASNAHYVGQPSGHLLAVSPSWHAYLNIVGGTGKLLRRDDLGTGRGAPPTARWSTAGNAVVLALPGSRPGQLELREFDRVRTIWRATLDVAGTDVMVIPQATETVTVVTASTSGWQAHTLLITSVSRTGAQLWQQRRVGNLAPLVDGSGLALVDLQTGAAEKLDFRTGTTKWLSDPLGPQVSYIPSVVGDIDGHGQPDLIFAGPTGRVAISGESGRLRFSIGDERVFAVADLDRNGSADLLTSQQDSDGQGELIRLRRGSDGKQLWSRDLRLGQDAQRLGAVASRSGSRNVLALLDFYGAVTVLDTRTGRELWRSTK